MTTSMVLLGLAAIWVAYLAVWWRDNRGRILQGSDRIDSFSRQLGSLGELTGSVVGAPGGLRPRSADEAARRRRLVIAVLGTLVAVTLLLSLVVGAPAFLANVVVDVVFIWYSYAVIQRRNLAAEREMKVTMLRVVPTPAQLEERQTINA